jgi:glycosyltransferase involved in cell wall biosynthesis
MKLIIQIPCFNEEKTLPLVLKEIPKSIKGVKKVEVVIIDDGSSDRTESVAKKYGATVLKHNVNRGLGNAFNTGLDYALKQNVDILVNTDADNQYPSRYIEKLVQKVINENCDMVIGNRRPWKVKYFSPFKRFMQWFGSSLIRTLTQTKVPDTVSGFRAYSKRAMRELNITTKFSYVLDTIMQASQKGLKIGSVPIQINPPTRKSRLFKNIFQHMWKSGMNILRIYSIYQPFKTFLALSLVFFVPGFILGTRFIYYFIINQGTGHIQSLIATAILLITSVMMFSLGIIGELLKTNRLLIERCLKNGK